jgi:hypothetical protein
MAEAAERGCGNVRVYTVTYTACDDSNHRAESSAFVYCALSSLDGELLQLTEGSDRLRGEAAPLSILTLPQGRRTGRPERAQFRVCFSFSRRRRDLDLQSAVCHFAHDLVAGALGTT